MKKILLLFAMMATFIGVSAQNPYAYKLSAGNQNDEGITINYTLNTTAKAVQIQLFDGATACSQPVITSTFSTLPRTLRFLLENQSLGRLQ